MKHILKSLLCFMPFLAMAQNEFEVSKIPEALKHEKNAVIRLDEEIFTRTAIDKATIQKHLVITILNEKGEEAYLNYFLYHDKLSKIKKLEGKIYDANGIEMDKLHKTDIRDISYGYFKGMVSDNRYTVAAFRKKKYKFPYTIEYKSTEKSKNMMFYPFVDLSIYKHVGIETARLTINTPQEFSFRYKDTNLTTPLSITEKDEIKTYTWLIKNIQVGEHNKQFLPKVETAPAEFEVQGYHSNIKSWKDLSSFMFELNKNRDDLPANIKIKIKELVKNETDTLKKIEALYHYMQSTTRYMNIQLGIGGWQTFSAMDVGKTGYGDCKALSNYMHALLKEAGIRSYVAIVRAGNDEEEVADDFPCARFNHVIACVPLAKDTLWLECTSQSIAMGYLGSFTGNRKALLSMPGDGAFVNTTRYTSADNSSIRKATVYIDTDGNAKSSVTGTHAGLRQEALNNVHNRMDQVKQKKYIIKHFPVPDFELQSFTLEETKARLPVMKETLEVQINKLVSKTGARRFLNPNLLGDFHNEVPSDLDSGTVSFLLNPNVYSFHITDTIVYKLPKNYSLNYMPEPVNIKSPFGSYTLSFTFKESSLIYTRDILMKGGDYPASDFAAFKELIKKINLKERQTIVFTESL